jgi:hypothetical protein
LGSGGNERVDTGTGAVYGGAGFSDAEGDCTAKTENGESESDSQNTETLLSREVRAEALQKVEDEDR